MGWTSLGGLELIRVTATTWPEGKELLDVLVRPFGEILDLNSRYSGVWPEHITDAIPWSDRQSGTVYPPKEGNNQRLYIVSSPAVARTLLFKLISPQTPLIGHGLENDLNALRILHPTVVDTALLFPHRAGLPYRNSLKRLMSQHLNRSIQMGGDTAGHDSKEDARAAGDLVKWKIGLEWKKMKNKGWSFVDGKLVSPDVSDSDKW
jgi:hypothetical protein